ncbi:restriction endonuclease type II-like protein, partial [Cladochytrium replicatum]
QSKPKKPRAPSTKEYVPQFRSGPYAILITLHTKTKSGEFMSKNEIIKLGQNLCESSFDVPAAGKQYTAWASMKLLVDRGLVFASGRPARYTITQEGRELAGRLMTATDNQRKQGGSSINVAITSRHSSPTEDEGTLTDEDDATRDRRAGVSLSRLVAFEKGTFYIEVVIDNREVRSRSNREYIQQKLQERGLKVSTRVLQLGDFMWVARKKDAQRPDEVNDIVLDYIIERKTMTDLTSSIKDGRFKEQKFRLSNCGVSNVIYLVEKDDMTMANAFGIQSIRSAIAMTQICDGFFVKETSNTDESIEYIARMTTRLNDIYKDRAIYAVHACDMSPELRPKLQHRGQYDNTNRSNDTPKGLDGNALHITYEAFSEANGKKTNFTRRDLWIRQLMTIRGISAEKASSIAKVFPTMQR